MARKPALSAETLKALGVETLAALVLDGAEQDATFRKRVLAALANIKGPEAVMAVLDKRLAALGRAAASIGWAKRKDFVADLDLHIAILLRDLAPAAPLAAAERILTFLAVEHSTMERFGEGSSVLEERFGQLALALPPLVGRLDPKDRMPIAEALLSMVQMRGYWRSLGVFADVLPLLPVQDQDKLDVALAKAEAKIRAEQGEAGEYLYYPLIRARQAIADAQRNVDRFAELDRGLRHHLQDPVGLAERLLTAGRLPEALDGVRRPKARRGEVPPPDNADAASLMLRPDEIRRIDLELRILEAMGHGAEAEALRWQTFEVTLSADILRDVLAHLPDFGEFEALDRAFAHAAGVQDHHGALDFFLRWPRLDLAAKLVLDHRGSWDGRRYDQLGTAAERLEADQPLAATILYRALIGAVLTFGRSAAYGHAAGYMARLAAIADRWEPRAGLLDHAAYRADLKRVHGLKYGFWTLVQAKAG
jgi:hypothetical protein